MGRYRVDRLIGDQSIDSVQERTDDGIGVGWMFGWID